MASSVKKTLSEILIEESGEVMLARVLLRLDTPFFPYPEYGVWCYMLGTADGVVILDPGPKRNTWFPFMRNRLPKLDNVNLIMEKTGEYFSGKTIQEILLSHYHFDHTEGAPDLQQRVKKKFGNLPPIRISREDFGNKIFLRVFNGGLGKSFQGSGESSWKFGDFLEDNEVIQGTDFIVRKTPFHTSGTIALVSDKYNVAIVERDLFHEADTVARVIEFYLDEAKSELENTRKLFEGKNYTYYYLHPQVEVKDKFKSTIGKLMPQI